MKIEDVYNELNQHHMCKSGYEFSRTYLGKNENYLSVLKSRRRQPSIEAWVMLSYTLQSRAQVLAKSENEFVLTAAARLSKLQQAVATNVMQEFAARNR